KTTSKKKKGKQKKDHRFPSNPKQITHKRDKKGIAPFMVLLSAKKKMITSDKPQRPHLTLPREKDLSAGRRRSKKKSDFGLKSFCQLKKPT
ncbi:hypothetical protein, partial [Streptomyces hygroscopicus]|uniref:hypothetical protein n=1 Tax=Streptomyces hygroscopicus TaxID=1912 RepID=UPI003F19BBCE